MTNRFRLTGPGLNIYVAAIGGILVYLMILGILFVTEQYEEKHNGYRLLSALPVKISEIITAKFLATGVTVLFYVVSAAGLLLSASGGEVSVSTALSFLLFNGCVGLLFCGLMYIGILSLSYTRFIIVFLIFTTMMGIVPLILTRSMGMEKVMEGFMNLLRTTNWMAAVPAAVLLYAGMGSIAVLLKRRFKG
ncbi:MAG: ABC-2 transporter permease [Candidatus Aminicenantes bacterium]|nr:ABC-2 transporter permease [Candidatus Aminicenantes bacterium]